MAIGDIGRWRDSAGGQIAGTSYGSFNFATEERNDNSTYSKPDAATIEFEESGIYMVRWVIQQDDSSNNRTNGKTRAIQAAGSGDFFTKYDSGFSRNSSNRVYTLLGKAFVVAAVNDQVTIQDIRDTDAPTGGSLADLSFLEVVKLADLGGLDYGIYQQSTGNQAYGGTTPNDVAFDATAVETDTASIELQAGSTDIRLKRDNARYWFMYGVSGDGGSSRTQRVSRAVTGSTLIPGSGGYAYQRNSANELAVPAGEFMHEVGTTDEDVSIQVWRGDGVAAGQGGADVDGSWNTIAAETTCLVIDMPDHWNSAAFYDQTGAQNMGGGASTALNTCRTELWADSPFSKSTDALATTSSAIDSWVTGTTVTARDNVSSGSRGTFGLTPRIGGVNQTRGEYKEYTRGNQGSQDCFGGGWHCGGIYALSASDTIGLQSIDRGDNGADDDTRPNYTGLFLLDLSSLESGGGTSAIVGDTTVAVSNTGALSGTGALTGSETASFSESASLGGIGELLYSPGAIEFTANATLTGVIPKGDWSAAALGPHGLPIPEYIFTSKAASSSPIVGQETISFTVSADISGRSALQGAETLSFSEGASLNAGGLLQAASSISFTESASISGGTGIQATETISFTESADLSGSGALVGSVAASFTESANLAAAVTKADWGNTALGPHGLPITPYVFAPANAQILGSTSLTFSESASISGGSTASASTSVDFTDSASLTATGDLQAATAVNLGSTTDLSGTGALQATETVTFSESVSLTDASAGISVSIAPYILPIPQYSFTAKTAAATGNLSATESIADVFDAIVHLDGKGELAGSVGIDFTESATASITASIQASTSIDFEAVARAAGDSALKASTSIDFGGLPTVSGTGAVSVSTLIQFSATAIANGQVLVEKRKKGGRVRKRYAVEIDGQIFQVTSIQEAKALLQQAQELASEAAESVQGPAIPKPPRVAVKLLSGRQTTSKVINEAVQQTRTEITRLYREAANRIERESRINREISELLSRKLREEQDEEDALIALLM